MSGEPPEAPQGQSIGARISNLVVHLMSTYTGRGPTKAWTSMDDELISVVLRDTLTKGERSLVSDSRSQVVLDLRKAYQNLADGVTDLAKFNAARKEILANMVLSARDADSFLKQGGDTDYVLTNQKPTGDIIVAQILAPRELN